MNFAKLANLAMDCEFGNAVANLAKWFANLAMGFANLAMGCEFGNGFAKLAMGLRSLQWGLRSWQCEISLRF